MREVDEPDWSDSNKRYSPEVRREMARIERNEATLIVFPVYWWSVPAILKGWIDRVWNNGWAYGDANFPQRRVWMIGICANSAAGFARRGYDRAMQTQLDIGILDYWRCRGASPGTSFRCVPGAVLRRSDSARRRTHRGRVLACIW